MSRAKKPYRPPAKADSPYGTAVDKSHSHTQAWSWRFPFSYFVVFFVLALGVIAAGYLYYMNFARELRVQAERQLTSIAELKVNDISRWRKERMGDAQVLYNNSAFSSLIKSYFADRSDKDAERKLQNWLDSLRTAINYDRISIIDVNGDEVIHSGGASEPISPHIQAILLELANTQKISFLDFHRCMPDEAIHLAVVAPILDEGQGEKLLGAVVLRIAPEDYLYPLITRWPVPSKSAETLLVRREGNDVVFLNELRLKSDTALKLRFPIEKTELPAAKAVLGKVGIVEGLDYRGVPVIADVRPVPDSPWFLVARIDKSEVFSPLRERLWLVMVLVGVLLIVSAVILLHIFSRQKIRYLRERYQAAAELQDSEARYRALFDNMHNGSIYSRVIFEGDTPADFLCLSANRAFEAMTGMAGIAGKRLTDALPGVRTSNSELFEALVRVAMSGEPEHIETWIGVLRKWYSLSAYCPEPNYVAVVLEDITERRRIEQDLYQSEKRFRGLYENSVLGIYQTTPDGRILAANPALVRMLGFASFEEMEQLRLDGARFGPGYDRRQFTEAMEKDGRIFGLEASWLRVDGSVLYIRENAVAVRDEGGTIIRYEGTVEDITDRMLAVQSLANEAIRRRILVDGSQDGIVVVDVNGKVVEANRKYAEMLGYTHEEVMQLDIWDWDTTFSHEAIQGMLSDVTEAGDHFETRHTRKDGSQYDVEISSNAAVINGRKLIFCVCRDITERKQAEAALKKSEDDMHLILDSATEGIYGNDLQGNCTFVNQAFLRILGYKSAVELIGKHIHTLIHHTRKDGTSYPSEECKIYQAFREGIGTHADDEVFWKADGTSIQVEYWSYPQMKDGQVIGAVATFVDISERKQAEEALRKSEEQLRSLFENMLNGFALHEIICDAQGKPVDYRFLNVNPAFERITGLKAEDIIGKTVLEILPETEQAWIDTYGKVALTGLPISFDSYTKSLNKHFEVATFSPGPSQFACLFADVTERKLAEEALRENERKLREAQEMAHLGYWSWDVETGDVEWSDEIYRIFQLDPHSFNPQIDSILALSPWPEDHTRDQELIQRAIASHEQGDYEQRFLRPDGSTGHYYSTFEGRYDDAGNLVTIVGTVLDITQRKLAETALRESEDLFRHIFEAANVGKSVTLPTGEVNVNKAFADMLGFSEDEIRYKTWQSLTPEEDIEASQKSLDPLLSGQKDTTRFEKKYRRKDGSIIWGDVSVTIRRDEGGNPLHFITTVVDITERKQAEERLREYQLHLEDQVAKRTDELEEKARHLSEAYAQMESFSYSVSHDLRAPLRHIQGFTELLIRNAGDALDAESRRLLNIVVSASSEMGRLVDELLTYSRTGRAEITRQEISLDKLMQDVYGVLTSMLEGREITFTVEKLPAVMGDPALINVVLSNLLSNAIKFTRHKEDAIISVSCVGSEDGYAVIRVKDNGAGFDMRYANKLFGVFQRLHSQDEFEGNGIGLATVRQIISRHGGRVWAEGEIGNGARFYFTLESADNSNRDRRRTRE